MLTWGADSYKVHRRRKLYDYERAEISKAPFEWLPNKREPRLLADAQSRVARVRTNSQPEVTSLTGWIIQAKAVRVSAYSSEGKMLILTALRSACYYPCHDISGKWNDLLARREDVDIDMPCKATNMLPNPYHQLDSRFLGISLDIHYVHCDWTLPLGSVGWKDWQLLSSERLREHEHIGCLATGVRPIMAVIHAYFSVRPDGCLWAGRHSASQTALDNDLIRR